MPRTPRRSRKEGIARSRVGGREGNVPLHAEDRPVLYLLLLVTAVVFLGEVWRGIRARVQPIPENVAHLAHLVRRGFRVLHPDQRGK